MTEKTSQRCRVGPKILMYKESPRCRLTAGRFFQDEAGMYFAGHRIEKDTATVILKAGFHCR